MACLQRESGPVPNTRSCQYPVSFSRKTLNQAAVNVARYGFSIGGIKTGSKWLNPVTSLYAIGKVGFELFNAAIIALVSGHIESPLEVNAAVGIEILIPTFPSPNWPFAGWCKTLARISYLVAHASVAAHVVCCPPC